MSDDTTFGQREAVSVATDRHAKPENWLGSIQTDVMRQALRKAVQITLIFMALLGVGVGGYIVWQNMPTAQPVEQSVEKNIINKQHVTDQSHPARGAFITSANEAITAISNKPIADVSGEHVTKLSTLYNAYLAEQWTLDALSVQGNLQTMADNRVVALSNVGLLDARKNIAQFVATRNTPQEAIPARWLSAIYEQDLQLGGVLPKESTIFTQEQKLFILLPLLPQASNNGEAAGEAQRNTMRAFLRGLLQNSAAMGVSTPEQQVPLARAIVDYLLLRDQERQKDDYLAIREEGDTDMVLDPVATRIAFNQAWNTPSDKELLAKIKQLIEAQQLVILPKAQARQLLASD